MPFIGSLSLLLSTRLSAAATKLKRNLRVFLLLSVIFFFIILRFVVSLFNFLSDPKLRRVGKQHYDKISILIPARNEADNILTLLNSILDQDHPEYEVIILDDNSTDDTYRICQRFANAHPRFSVIKGEPLPDGWLGKNFACHQLAQQATGEYLLFIDADTRIAPGLLNSALHRMQLRKLNLLSVFADAEMRTLAELTVTPLTHYLLLNLLPLQLIYLVKNKIIAEASGQFMLFDAAHYRTNQWHTAVKHKVVEDVDIMRLVKQRKLNGEALLANGLFSSRNFKTYGDAVNGLSRGVLSAFNYNVLSLLFYLIILLGGPLMVVATLDLSLIMFMCGLIILGRIMISLSARQSAWRNMLLHPIQMLNLMLIAFLAIQRYLTKTTVWKGRRV
ncbi:glycosyltransferase [Mucilaginibacter myungsuensis]|uniref:Glycosyltransferase n=1 Tax=Mucilaginibacter myungsuensis TaxID=649104 RepID=A0A929L0P0_9SPHI|nr:glycosyltransferase family 2 protein [Mucilaginibacter myungsuensis]MBE9661126.1 glycosyltransferase [Mucilaginibacter myungsuensis]MDN3597271.1 glycosyltransferase family 2 protein [Mucilaginibacter myungsuensis]